MPLDVYTPTEWKDLPDESTPIDAEKLNKLELAVKDNRQAVMNLSEETDDLRFYTAPLLQEETITVEPIAPWTGNITLTRKGNAVHIDLELDGDKFPWGDDNIQLFIVPEGFRTVKNIFITGYGLEGVLPIHYYAELFVFYVNTKLFLSEGSTANFVAINTHYMID